MVAYEEDSAQYNYDHSNIRDEQELDAVFRSQMMGEGAPSELDEGASDIFTTDGNVSFLTEDEAFRSMDGRPVLYATSLYDESPDRFGSMQAEGASTNGDRSILTLGNEPEPEVGRRLMTPGIFTTQKYISPEKTEKTVSPNSDRYPDYAVPPQTITVAKIAPAPVRDERKYIFGVPIRRLIIILVIIIFLSIAVALGSLIASKNKGKSSSSVAKSQEQAPREPTTSVPSKSPTAINPVPVSPVADAITPTPATTPATSVPSASPVAQVTEKPVPRPPRLTKTPTVEPVAATASPLMAPVKVTSSPTKEPIRLTTSPTKSPSKEPVRVTISPTESPTKEPVRVTASPTGSPTKQPIRVTISPTESPTKEPIRVTASPTQSPVKAPTLRPSIPPVVISTFRPTASPTAKPTRSPTVAPTISPTASPTLFPSANNVNLRQSIIAASPPSTAIALQNSGSAQSLALSWILNTPSNNGLTFDRLMQRFALATFYYDVSNGGKNQLFGSSPWLQNSNECFWYGVSCQNGAVVGLNVSGSSLYGTFPPELGILGSTIQTLDISYNDIYGSLPTEIGLFANLQEFRMEKNAFAGSIPTQAASMDSLVYWDFHWNAMTGSFPNNVVLDMASLKRINLYHNYMTGSVVQNVCRLNLQELVLDCYEVSCNCWTRCFYQPSNN